MSVFLPIRRATLLIPSGPAHDLDRKHLFILLTDPANNPETGKTSVLLTSLSTLNTELPHDPTCILHPGDHPFINRDSYVSYSTSRIQEAAKIVDGVASGVLIAKDLMELSIVDTICNGLAVSPHTAPKILRFYRLCASRHT